MRRARRGRGALGVGDADGAAVDGVAAGRVVPPGLAPAHGRAAPGHLRRGGKPKYRVALRLIDWILLTLI